MRWRSWLIAGLALAASGCGPRPMPGRVLTRSREGWTRTGRIERFAADNLYEVIDGEADFVIAYGFRSLTQAVYRRDGAESTVDIYDVGSPDYAFGLFRSRANVEARPTEVGSEGVADEARVEFWQGPYYVAVGVPEPEHQEAALALARSLARDLPPTAAWPAYLALLPTGRRVPRSEQFTPSSFLGQAALLDAVSARYKLGDGEATVFACRYDTARAAAAALGKFRAFLDKQQPTVATLFADGGFVAKDPILGEVAVFRRGAGLGGMTGYAKGPPADALLADLDRRLRAR